MVELPVYKF